jgi:magnesium transporter
VAAAIAHQERVSSHLARRVPVVDVDASVSDAHTLLVGSRFDVVDLICVIDRVRHLVGVVPIADLLAADSGLPIVTIMLRSPPTVGPDTDQERAATLAVRHGLSALPVVDSERRVLGVIPPHALQSVLRQEHVEDLHRLAGIRREARQARVALEGPPARRARDRLPWLLVGLSGTFVAAVVMSRFERLLAERVELIFFVPAIVYLADAIGTQTEAVVVRGLSVSHQPLRKLLAGELLTGAAIGAVLALLAFIIIATTLADARVAAAVALAIFVAGSLATTIGMLLPWAIHRFGRDPAFGSGPVATILQDVVSLVVYLGISSLLVR